MMKEYFIIEVRIGLKTAQLWKLVPALLVGPAKCVSGAYLMGFSSVVFI